MKQFKPIGELYQSKDNRNKRFKDLINSGLQVVRRSVKNVLIHPQYIEDYNKEGLNKGFGNSDYKTSFSVLYKIERRF